MSISDSTLSPVTIPLHPTFVPGTGFKIGIQAGFSPDPQDWRMFEFDTGGGGFWAGYGPFWPQVPAVPPSQQITNHYASGNEYTAIPTQATVYFAGSQPGPAAVSTKAVVAQVQTASGPRIQDWQQDIDGGTPPLYQNFYGDFGATLKPYTSPNYPAGMPSVLLQMEGGLNNGFIVQVGPYPTDPSQAVAASLQIGLAPGDISGAANRLPVVMGEKGLTAQGVLYVNGEPVNSGNPGAPQGSAASPPPAAVLFDSGAPSTHIWTGTVIQQQRLERLAGASAGKNGKGTLPPGVELKLVYGDVVILQLTTGTETGKNLVSFSPAPSDPTNAAPGANPDPAGYVNTGVVPFFGNRITFYPDDAQGFIAISPAASGTAG